jgi:hypothetical protein
MRKHPRTTRIVQQQEYDTDPHGVRATTHWEHNPPHVDDEHHAGRQRENSLQHPAFAPARSKLFDSGRREGLPVASTTPGPIRYNDTQVSRGPATNTTPPPMRPSALPWMLVAVVGVLFLYTNTQN